MATYNSTRGGSSQSAKSRTGVVVDYCEFTVTAALALNDVINLFNLPAMARVLAFAIDVPDLDSNGAPAIKLNVGDTANGSAQYVSQSTVGQSAGIISYPKDGVAGSVGTRYTADDKLAITVQTGPATGATTGTFHAWVMYEMDGGTQTGF